MRRPNRGFTLIETVLAMAIFGIAIVGLTAAFVNTLQALSTLQRQADYSPYIRFVRSHAISITDLDEFEDGGDIRTPDNGEARWSAEVEPMDVVDLFQVWLTIELTLPDQREPHVHEETFYVLRPTWSDPFERSIRLSDAQDDLERQRSREGRFRRDK